MQFPNAYAGLGIGAINGATADILALASAHVSDVFADIGWDARRAAIGSGRRDLLATLLGASATAARSTKKASSG